jgi:putative hydrolase of the HAD superfamily
MIKAVCFDFFNTIAGYDPPREKIFLEICNKHGIGVDPKALASALPSADKYHRDENRRSPIDKRSKLGQMNFYMNHATIALRGAGVKINKIIAWEMVMAFKKYTWDMKIYPDSADALKAVKQKGLTVGVISNIDKEMESITRDMGIDTFIDFYVTSVEAGCEKPAPGIFMLALKKAGVSAEEAVYVGDQYELDVLGAANAGIKAILMDRNRWFADLKDTPRIEKLPDIVNYI